MRASAWGGYPSPLGAITLPTGLQNVAGKLQSGTTSLITGYREDPDAYVGAATGIARVGSWLVGSVKGWRQRRAMNTATIESASLAAAMPQQAPAAVVVAPPASPVSLPMIAVGLGALGLLAFALTRNRGGQIAPGMRSNPGPYGVIGIATVGAALAAVSSAIGIGAAVKRGVENRRAKKAAGQTWRQRRKGGGAVPTSEAYVTSSGMVAQGPAVETVPVYDQVSMQADAYIQQQKTMLWALVGGGAALAVLLLALRGGGSAPAAAPAAKAA